MRGLEFSCKNEYGFLLNDVFSGFSLNCYDWYIPDSEVIYESGGILDIPYRLSGESFQKIIHEKPYLVYSIQLQAWQKGTTMHPISDYRDFQSSDCELVLFIVDCTFGEVYSKRTKNTVQLINNLEKAGCTSIMIKTDQEDGREVFSI